jgi:uncharacterized repeat protein (TIGR01451 family)
VKNTVTATGKDPSNNNVSDVSDDGDDTDGNTTNDETVTSITAAPALKAVKTALTPNGVKVGDPINYTITVKNTGNVTITNVTLADTLTTASGGSLALTSGPTFSSGTNGATATSLPPNETLTYAASFTITQAAVNAGGVKNTVTATGKDPSNNNVSDVSDDGDDTDGNTTNDETVTGIPNLTLSKTPLGTTEKPLLAGSPSTYEIGLTNNGTAASSGATILETISTGLQLNSIGGTGWSCTYSNGQPLTLPAKGPLTVRCSTTQNIAAAGGKPSPINVSVTPLPGFLGLKLTTDASVDQTGGNNPPPTGSSCSPSSVCASNGGEVTPEALPTVGISFAAPSIPVNGQTRITVVIINKTGSPLTSLSQSQALPAGLAFFSDPKVITDCNGVVNAAGSTLALSGGSLAAGGSCTFSALVTSSSPSGTQFTASVPVGAIKNTENKTNEAGASAGLAISGSFAVRKSFQSSQGALGIPVKMTITVDNTGTQALSEASLVDQFPAAPGTLAIADDPKLENTCSGTVTATPKATQLSLSGGTVPPGGCAISVMVVADTVGDYLNVIAEGGTAGSPNGLRGKLPDGSALSSVPGTSARVNVALPAGVSGVFTKRVGFGQQVPQGGVTVILKDAEGRVVATTVTKADGSYSFENLPPTLLGDSTTKYTVEFKTSSSTAATALVKGSPESPDPSLNGQSKNNGISGITLKPGSSTPSQNGFLVDPSGVVYDSVTRQPVAGARVTLLGPTGSPVPNNLLDLTAGTANGAAVGSDGLYVLLLTSEAPSGLYRLRVDVPNGYQPGEPPGNSAYITAEKTSYQPGLGGGIEKVQPQDTAPTLSENTRYYMSVSFVITDRPETSSNGIIHNHIPIDPTKPVVVGDLQTTKTGSVRSAELGDSVGYAITVKNATNVPQYGVVLKDTLPVGFKYIGGTSSLKKNNDSISADSALGVKDGERVLNYSIGTMLPGESATLSYRARIGVGSLSGDGINRAMASSLIGTKSNEARYGLRLDAGVFSSEACVIGAVYRDCNDNGVRDENEPGVPGVRLYFSDGAYMVSDQDGRYSLCGRRPSTQALKVDPSTVPEGSVLGSTSNRDAGDPSSLFLDLKNGEMHRADFRILGCSIERRVP